MLSFAFITEAWHVYLLNAAARLETACCPRCVELRTVAVSVSMLESQVLLGPQALAFPATSAIKSRLVAESELRGGNSALREALDLVCFGTRIAGNFLLSEMLHCGRSQCTRPEEQNRRFRAEPMNTQATKM